MSDLKGFYNDNHSRYKDKIKVKSKKKIKRTRRRKPQVNMGFYDLPQWKDLRFRVLKEQGAVCALCGASPRTGAVMHVDHIKPRSRYPELEMNINNLQVLCADCNLGKLHRDDTDFRTLHK